MTIDEIIEEITQRSQTCANRPYQDGVTIFYTGKVAAYQEALHLLGELKSDNCERRGCLAPAVEDDTLCELHQDRAGWDD